MKKILIVLAIFTSSCVPTKGVLIHKEYVDGYHLNDGVLIPGANTRMPETYRLYYRLDDGRIVSRTTSPWVYMQTEVGDSIILKKIH